MKYRSIKKTSNDIIKWANNVDDYDNDKIYNRIISMGSWNNEQCI